MAQKNSYNYLRHPIFMHDTKWAGLFKSDGENEIDYDLKRSGDGL